MMLKVFLNLKAIFISLQKIEVKDLMGLHLFIKFPTKQDFTKLF